MVTSLCRVCGHPCRRDRRRYAWVHVRPGADHPPIPLTP